MKLYDCSVQDTENRIEELAAQYVPEWHFDRSDPDIGSAIAKIFAIQMQENVGLVNRMMDRYHAEFVNMLDISLKPAKPAGSLVQFNLIENSVPGTMVRKGTRLVSASGPDSSGSVLFETDREIYVTNSRIVDAFMTDREEGTFVPLLGKYRDPEIVEGMEIRDEEEEIEAEAEVNEEETETEEERGRNTIRPFVLFSEKGNIARSILILYHESVFDLEDEPIYIRISGNPELNKRIGNKEFRFRYYSKSGLKDFDRVELKEDGETFELEKHDPNAKFNLGNREYAIVILEAKDTIKQDIEADGISLSSSGRERPLEFVNDGSIDMDTDKFEPFTDTLSVYNECYLGSDVYFSKGGALITLTFHVNYGEKGLYLTKQEEEVQLKIFKKKPKVIAADIPADAYADEIVLEYFNGTGWRKLRCNSDVSEIFARVDAGDYEISFICPDDWAVTQSGAYIGRAIRMRLIKSDNCFLRPGIHHYPIISDMKVSFSFRGHFVAPGRTFLFAGTQRREITKDVKAGGSFIILSGGKYSDDALYLGFDKKMEGGPVSIYFELSEVINTSFLKCRFEYSTIHGFKRMKVVDHTLNFSRSGSIMFIPPSDMAFVTLEDRRRIWIRISRVHAQSASENSLFLPRIQRILVNVIGVSNIVTGNEENYYISESGPNLHFNLPQGNILDAEVWVNEKGALSAEEIERMKDNDPGSIRVEYDMLGNVSAAYVKWEETDSFLNKNGRRVYMIDRAVNELIFSDGKKADIPRVVDDVSFKVRVRVSNGYEGNVEAGAISEFAGTELYMDSVTNPVRSYGGSNMETVHAALRRGANVIYGRGRLVSANDYKWSILSYSDSIDKVACIEGDTINGVYNDADVSFVLLMRDFADGSFSFHSISEELKKYLLTISSVTISPDNIHIVEPIFVSVSVNVWADVGSIDESFETQNLIKSALKYYFNPVSEGEDPGWDIGVIPKISQIKMKLSSLKSKAVIRKISVIANYVDRDGAHETDLSDLKVSPFMVVKSGEHKVHINLSSAD
ncbi:MAG: hypothetical protein IJU87_01950 [Lachnospiraceae bacterium]|nr:hypothetical protein [Lachnospiraceae bacterium]